MLYDEPPGRRYASATGTEQPSSMPCAPNDEAQAVNGAYLARQAFPSQRHPSIDPDAEARNVVLHQSVGVVLSHVLKEE